MMKPTVAGFVCITLAFSITDTVRGQRVEVPESGRVRVTARGWQPSRVIGTVIRAEGDTVMLHTGDSLVAIPRDRVTRVEVPHGRRRHVLTGLLIGLGAGTMSGALLGVAGCGPGTDCQNDFAATTTAGGAGIGMVVGAGVGALITGDRWRNAASPPRTVAIAPAFDRRGVTLIATLPVR